LTSAPGTDRSVPGASRWIRHTVQPDDEGLSVQEILTGRLGISRRMIQRLTRSRGITLNSRPAFLSRPVRSGDVVAVRVLARETTKLPPAALPLSIVHEDADLIVVDKPPGLLVHPTAPSHTRTLAHGIAGHLARHGVEARVRPVHRLDRETSGLVIFAKSGFAHQHLDRQLRQGTLEREYLALVEGVVPEDEGVIQDPIGPARQDPRLRMVRVDGQEAITRYTVEERFAAATALRVTLETGRTHQIRVHLAHRGNPVIGDRAYGARPTRSIGRPALHARRVTLLQPRSGERLEFEAPPPEDILALLDALRGSRME
jgi:23S rRNA pseudouridine1911/1915/1917 synthase